MEENQKYAFELCEDLHNTMVRLNKAKVAVGQKDRANLGKIENLITELNETIESLG
jgi:hypothetical protein